MSNLEIPINSETTIEIRPSSSITPHIWLGVKDCKASIQYNDALALGLDLQKRDEETNEFGWCDYPLPKEVLIESDMHLSQDLALELAKVLYYFAQTGEICENFYDVDTSSLMPKADKFLYIEDGSVDINDLNKELQARNMTDIMPITYRQGANMPKLISIEDSKNEERKDVV